MVRVFSRSSGRMYRAAGGIVQINVRQSFPSAPDADDLAPIAATIYHRLDDGIQSGNVAAAGKNPNAFFCHERSLVFMSEDKTEGAVSEELEPSRPTLALGLFVSIHFNYRDVVLLQLFA